MPARDDDAATVAALELDDADIPDTLLELLVRLARGGEVLSQAVRQVADSRAARPPTRKWNQQLVTLAARIGRHLPAGTTPPELTLTGGPRGTPPTDAVRSLSPAAELILVRRQRERVRRHLEEVQLASALDLRALRIGGYQAHMERFLGRLVAELNVDFPWVTTSVELYQNRVREERGVRVVHGDLKQAFEDGDVDYMLEPEDQGNVSPFPPVYRYSFRVVATEDRLREVRRTQKKGRAEGSHITDLHGKKLLLAPEGHSSRRRIESLLKKYHVEPADRVPVPTPLMLRVRALAGEGYAIISDEYGPIGSAQERFPALLVDHDVDSDYASTFTVPMILRVRDGLSGGIHAALATVVERLSEEEGRRPEARFSAVF